MRKIFFTFLFSAISIFCQTPNEYIVTDTSQKLGSQMIIEFFGCDEKSLDDITIIETVMLSAAEAANATIVAHKFHQFAPQGVSGAVIVAESHFAIHTWPEYNYCHVDIFTCGEHTDNAAALEVIKNGLSAKKYKSTSLTASTYQEIIQENKKLKIDQAMN